MGVVAVALGVGVGAAVVVAGVGEALVALGEGEPDPAVCGADGRRDRCCPEGP